MSKRVLITGGAGFIGHHMIQYFLENTDYEVVSLDRLDSSGTLNRLESILIVNSKWKSRLRIVWHDLKAPMNGFVKNAVGNCDYILHLAAGSHVDRSIDDPLLFVMDNVVGTCNILNFARECSRLEKFLYFSTDEVFGSAVDGVYFKEWDNYKSGNPYSATKAGGEELCVAFHNTYSLPIIITHTMNVFGVRQHPEKYIPLCIRKIDNDERIYIHADKNMEKAGKRHYVDARDVAEAVEFLIEIGINGDKYNICGASEVDNLSMAILIAKIMGKELIYELVDFHSSRPGHDLRYALDGSKMKELGWSPRIKVEDGLSDIVEWTLKNKEWLHV